MIVNYAELPIASTALARSDTEPVCRGCLTFADQSLPTCRTVAADHVAPRS